MLADCGAWVVGGIFKPEAARLRVIALDLYKRIDDRERSTAGLRPIFEEWGGIRFDMALSIVAFRASFSASTDCGDVDAIFWS